MPVYHPHPNEYGKKVVLTKPSNCSGPEAWECCDSHATVTPGSDMPESVNGIAVRSWANSPTCSSGWEALVADCTFEEPPFPAVAGKKAASGAVVIEPDGRVWMISPSNQFGGYINTFPKGSMAGSDRISLRANAVKEAYEEMGLKIELRGYLLDSVRSTSVTRYYLGRRLDGCPSTMGWESQAVHLVPPALLHSVASHPNDAPILAALEAYLAAQESAGRAGDRTADLYWIDALERYSSLRELGCDRLILDLDAIERILKEADSPAHRLLEVMSPDKAQEGSEGASRLLLALLMRLAERGGHVARPVG